MFGWWDQEDQAELLQAAGLDPEALAALPPEMRQEVLEQVSHSRLSRSPFPRDYVLLLCRVLRSPASPLDYVGKTRMKLQLGQVVFTPTDVASSALFPMG